MKYDFGGYATKVDLRCSDGRTIRSGAFKNDDGRTVPLVWNHQRNEPDNILGSALLEHRDEGVYAYCKFNENPKSVIAKSLVEHGDIRSLSIYANQLMQKGADVLHGAIREVSLVLAGANPGACIDNLAIEHSDGTVTTVEEEAYIYFDDPISTNVEHAEKDSKESEETVQDVFNTLTDKQKQVVYFMIGQALEDSGSENDETEEDRDVEHADSSEETVQDVFNTLTDKQKQVVYFMIGQALEDSDAEHSDKDSNIYEGGNSVTMNVFENNTTTQTETLSPHRRETGSQSG